MTRDKATTSGGRRGAALLALVIVMIVWGSTFVVTKAAVEDFPPLTLAFLRFAIASLLLWQLARPRGGLGAALRKVRLRRLVLLAFAGVAVFTCSFNYAMVYGSAAQGALLYATVPAVVAIAAALFLKERLHGRRVLGIALSIAGAALIVLSGEERTATASAPLLGAAFMLVAVLVWGLYTVAAKALATLDQIVLIFAISTIGALLLVPASAIELAVVGIPAASARAWLGVIYLSVFASAGAYVLYSFALRELDASAVGAFNNIDPVVGLATAFLFLGESLTAVQGVGALVVLAGMWLASTEDARAVAES
jgi:drug/metabolite transporter (DMT)-like permease